MLIVQLRKESWLSDVSKVSKVTQQRGDKARSKSQVSSSMQLLNHHARQFGVQPQTLIGCVLRLKDCDSRTTEIPSSVFTNKFLGPSARASNAVSHGWIYEHKLFRGSLDDSLFFFFLLLRPNLFNNLIKFSL